ncbi:MAG: hypothetical protein QME90_06975 [Thermodesulfobacteriota bacterium]|nr:hypothetical protein [Thermodesulfobacteriota bacterium]
MENGLKHHASERSTKVGNLLFDLSSMEYGFLEIKRYRQEIWDYIQYRKSLVKWLLTNERIKGGVL